MSNRIALFTRMLKAFPPLFDLSRKFYRLTGRVTPASNALDRIFGGRSSVKFIQVGSNDGMSDDPLREFILKGKSWSGVFVEPVPSLLKTCQKSYGYYRLGELHYFNGAVSDQMGRLQIWKLKEASKRNFPLFAGGMASADKSHWTRNFPKIGNMDSMLESIDVECITFRQLAERFKVEEVDLLVLDVEGHEAQILDSIFRDGPMPRVILFETAHFDQDVLSAIEAKYEACGYRLWNLGIDCLAIRDPELQELMHTNVNQAN